MYVPMRQLLVDSWMASEWVGAGGQDNHVSSRLELSVPSPTSKEEREWRLS
jgi:hypothetical protein